MNPKGVTTHRLAATYIEGLRGVSRDSLLSYGLREKVCRSPVVFEICVYGSCTCMYVYVRYCVPGAQGSQKPVLDPLEIELEVIMVNNHMGAEKSSS